MPANPPADPAAYSHANEPRGTGWAFRSGFHVLFSYWFLNSGLYIVLGFCSMVSSCRFQLWVLVSCFIFPDPNFKGSDQCFEDHFSRIFLDSSLH